MATRNRVRPALRGVLILCLLLFGLLGCLKDEPQVDRDLAAARDAYSKGFYLEAEGDYERYLQSRQDGDARWEAWNRLLDIAMNVKDDPDRAASLLEAMYLEAGSDPAKAAELLCDLGRVYERKGDWGKAMTSYEKALEVIPAGTEQDARVRLDIVRVYRGQGNYDLAIQTLKACVDRAEKPSLRDQCRYELAQTYSFVGSWGQAKTTLEELVAADDAPEETVVMSKLLLADVYEHDRDRKKALEMLESIRDRYPNPMVIDSRIKGLKEKSLPANASGDDFTN